LKYAVIADIHANLAALEAVLTDVEKDSAIAEIWCLGDIVGYGPDPHRCIEIIEKRCSACIAGNHDWAAIDKIDSSSFNPDAAVAIEWTSRQLKTGDIHFLESLPMTLEKKSFTLAHGSPHDPIWEYILSPQDAEKSLGFFKTPNCFIGHSHSPAWFECTRSCSRHGFLQDTSIKLGKRRHLITPGSVGQPRDGIPDAAYAIYDSDAETVTLRRIPYDIAETQQRMQDAGLPEWLIGRLAEGR